MSHKLVKILSSDDREVRQETKWCLVEVSCGDECTLCQGEYFGAGAGCEYETKIVDSGGIECEECLAIINKYKAIKL